ncbi:MAG: hypothetical protein A3F84_04135 [Candidatus Handelsmanbacteria bacterium RIFCSPLOWO2_12_FULL_64_10]|uniref:LamG-like jellyroll fold domain-containing protein n=1 Tax=Handelsmanbacteria sp. (strain RIFCSPLOWO2_12_FULL_64_10) TaxID=1817868 RepID=A0A1F6CSV3_HANXR|nr:MAG: hypothetical protein A3F84_04135 [Candidatus Handelsmanbacteria bacterium RIFCSPLOWO2_12_FULL_64_10]
MNALLALIFLCALLARPAAAQNRALKLDGDGDYVQLPGNVFNSLTEATVEAWVRWDAFNSSSAWFSYGSPRDLQVLSIHHYANTRNVQFIIYDAGHNFYHARAYSDLPAGQWCHMAAVSGPSGMKLYLNGGLAAEWDFTGSFASLGSGAEFSLGRATSKESRDLRGQLDEVRVWSTARTEAQIRATMYQRLTGQEPGLVGLWNFDAGDARDLSPSGHHGRLMGDATCVVADLPNAVRTPARLSGRVLDAQGKTRVGVTMNLYNLSLRDSGLRFMGG